MPADVVGIKARRMNSVPITLGRIDDMQNVNLTIVTAGLAQRVPAIGISVAAICATVR